MSKLLWFYYIYNYINYHMHRQKKKKKKILFNDVREKRIILQSVPLQNRAQPTEALPGDGTGST